DGIEIVIFERGGREVGNALLKIGPVNEILVDVALFRGEVKLIGSTLQDHIVGATSGMADLGGDTSGPNLGLRNGVDGRCNGGAGLADGRTDGLLDVGPIDGVIDEVLRLPEDDIRAAASRYALHVVHEVLGFRLHHGALFNFLSV